MTGTWCGCAFFGTLSLVIYLLQGYLIEVSYILLGRYCITVLRAPRLSCTWRSACSCWRACPRCGVGDVLLTAAVVSRPRSCSSSSCTGTDPPTLSPSTSSAPPSMCRSGEVLSRRRCQRNFAYSALLGLSQLRILYALIYAKRALITEIVYCSILEYYKRFAEFSSHSRVYRTCADVRMCALRA